MTLMMLQPLLADRFSSDQRDNEFCPLGKTALFWGVVSMFQAGAVDCDLRGCKCVLPILDWNRTFPRANREASVYRHDLAMYLADLARLSSTH